MTPGGKDRKAPTSCEVPVDGLLRHAVQSLHVILAVPDPQLLPWPDISTGAEVNPLTVLERHQVLFSLLPGYGHVPEGKDETGFDSQAGIREIKQSLDTHTGGDLQEGALDGMNNEIHTD